MSSWRCVWYSLFLLLTACSGNDGSRRSFRVVSTEGTVTGASPIVVRGVFGVYLASEALTGLPPGTNLNSDSDTTDEVAVLVVLNRAIETCLGVAAISAEILADDAFLQVDEAADGVDWNGGGLTDQVLLYFERSTETLVFVDTLHPGLRNSAMHVAGTRLYYSSAATGLMAGETSLRYIQAGLPTIVNPIGNADLANAVSPILMGEDDGLLFLLADEFAEGRDLNGDGMLNDASVLSLLDTTTTLSTVRNVGLALRDENEPIDAELVEFGDWTVAFLVDEFSQEVGSLNDSALFPDPLVPAFPDCMRDQDVMDRVLHFLEFADFASGAAQPVNTGLAGTLRVLAVEGAVGTLSFEGDANCNMNRDSDTTDYIVRWLTTAAPRVPSIDVAELHAVDITLPGGAMGLASLTGRLIAVVDEAQDERNLDMKAAQHKLVAWLDPLDGAAATWTFAHQGAAASIGTGIFEDVDGDGLGDPGRGASEPYAGTSWMAAEERDNRLGITFLEEVPGTNPNVPSINSNTNCGFQQKDTDLVDALPVWLDFSSGPTLDFDGVGYAVEPTNAGVDTLLFTSFFRLSEAADSVDYNGDNVLDDFFLMRNPTLSCGPSVMSVASNVPGPLLHSDGIAGAMFLADESFGMEDLNGDGDCDDLVVRYFVF